MFITPTTFKAIAQATAQHQANKNPVGWTSVQQKEDQEPVAQTTAQQQTNENRVGWTTAQQQANKNPVGWTSVQQQEDQKPITQTSTQQQTPKNYKNRPSHDAQHAIDASKITKELNCTPQETSDSGIRKTVQWYLDSQDWLQHVLDGSYQCKHLEPEKCTHAN